MIDQLPLVSIITPAYNRADYLEEVILSVLNQDYPNIEYIVLDDGSMDNTVELLKKYTGKLVWESHANMGETRTVNKGYRMASGEYIAIVNSDDPILPGAISQAVEFMNNRPEILVAYPDWLYIGPKGEQLNTMIVPEFDYVYMVRRHHCVVGPGAMIRRKTFSFTGLRDPEYKFVADFEYWMRLGLYGPFARIPLVLATFRVHPDSASISSKGKLMADEHIRMMKKYYSDKNLPLEIKQVRSEAFGKANLHAARECGSARLKALKHYLQFILYYPKGILEINWLKELAKLLPLPAYNWLKKTWKSRFNR